MTSVTGAANAAQAQRWNGESGRYWIRNRERLLAEHRFLVSHLFTAAEISPGERVLDIGCGCGETTIAAARAAEGTASGAGGFAVGLDLSGPMLDVAHGLAMQCGARNVGFVRGDAQTCPLREASCDLMISSFGVMFFDNPAAAFARIASVIGHGGRLAFLCWQHDSCNELLAIPLHAFSDYMQLPSPTVGDIFVDSRQITRLLSSTGWRDVDIDALSEPARIGTDVADVMNYVGGMPVIRSLLIKLKDKALAEQVLDTIAEEYSARQRPDGVWVRAAAWLVTAQRA